MKSDAPLAKDVDCAKPSSGAFVQSLQRGLAVICAFDAQHPRLTLSEVAQRTDLTRAAARRFLHTLVQLGYVDTDGKQFSLRAKVLELGYAYLASLTLPELAQPHMEALVERIRVSCSMSVLEGGEVFYIARVPSRYRLVSASIPVGTRFPAYATAMGRVLLGELPQETLDKYLLSVDLAALAPKTVTDPGDLRNEIMRAKRQGYAIVEEELREGLASVAVPVRLPNGSVVASLNLSTHDSRATAVVLRRELLPDLQKCALDLEDDLRKRHLNSLVTNWNGRY